MPEPTTFQWVIQAGAAGALLLFVVGFARGWWRTKWEVEAWKEMADQAIAALKERVTRAETQVDTLLPAIDRLTDRIEDQIERIQRP